MCAKCQEYIGLVDTATQGYRLRKPSLSISPSASAQLISYRDERWLSCHLLSAAENQGVRKLSVWTAEASEPGIPVFTIQIWLFATDLTISSSVAETSEPLHVVKAMYREGQRPESGSLNAAALGEGELELDKKDWWDLRGSLDLSRALLPPKARMFQGWSVGLLRRFTLADVAFKG